MANNRRKAERRREIEVVREEARAAFAAGKPRSSCPYLYCNMYQWQNAYDVCAAQAERDATYAQQLAASDRFTAVIDAISEVDDLETQVALHAIFGYVREQA